MHKEAASAAGTSEVKSKLLVGNDKIVVFSFAANKSKDNTQVGSASSN